MTIEQRALPTSEADMRAQIERARAQLVGTAGALRRELHDAWDPRAWVRRRPAVTLGLAFMAGVWLGTRRRR
jgi:hypothetical protein